MCSHETIWRICLIYVFFKKNTFCWPRKAEIMWKNKNDHISLGGDVITRWFVSEKAPVQCSSSFFKVDETLKLLFRSNVMKHWKFRLWHLIIVFCLQRRNFLKWLPNKWRHKISFIHTLYYFFVATRSGFLNF